MCITEITESMLPLFLIETIGGFGCEWKVFTLEPFATQKEAEDHRLKVLAGFPALSPDNIRVAPYTKAHWRKSLIEAVMEDDDAMERALSVLRNETLVDLLK